MAWDAPSAETRVAGVPLPAVNSRVKGHRAAFGTYPPVLAQLEHDDEGGPAHDVNVLVARWLRHRIKAGLVKTLTVRNQRSQIEYFVDAHGATSRLRSDRRVFEKYVESIAHLSAAQS